MSVDDQILLLRKQMEESINNCDFKQARLLNSRISSLKSQRKQNLLIASKNEEKILYQKEVSEAQSDYLTTREKFIEKIIQKKLNHQQIEKNLNDQYANRRKILAEQYGKDIDVTQNRTVVEADVLVHCAKMNARFKNFDTAEEMYSIGNSTRKKVQLKRLQELSDKYQHELQKLDLQYQKEIDTNNDNLKSELDYIDIRYELECTRIKKRLQVAALRFHIEKPIAITFSPIRSKNPDECIEMSPFSSPKTSSKNSSSEYHSPKFHGKIRNSYSFSNFFSYSSPDLSQNV